ncbi:hypothetical protein DFH11DRAFT_1575007 [Phellopilus nigrolimitatus]|nr:hypothetical protein DFH11DRAFT_1575007 [Phellopilus nigrolimitatus]
MSALCARRSFARSAIVAARKVQSVSPLAPIGAAADPTFKPRPTLQKEFSLTGRVAIVSGANRGLGLEMAESLCEAGAIVYALDTNPEPGNEWKATRSYVERMGVEGARLEYASVDVTDQKTLWNTVEAIASKEGRMDVCIAAAAILHGETCLNYKADDFNRVMNVNATGVLHTAQAAGRMMAKYGTPGSIILIASMSGGITNRVSPLWFFTSTKLTT